MSKKIILLILFFSFGCATKSAKIESLKSEKQLYALYNIHIDPRNNRIYTTNYQQDGNFIPVCSKITITDSSSKVIKFTANSDSKEYSYLYQRAVGEKLEDHIQKVFGPNCHKSEMNSLSGIDREGIRKAEPLKGMTKKGVVFAIGNAPSHINNYSSNEWTYWKNRFNRFIVNFDKSGRVKSIKN